MMESTESTQRSDDELIGEEGCSNLPPLNEAADEERLRRKLQFHFMNPIEKWEAKRRIPYKFIVQLIKIVLVTMQLCLYSFTRYQHVNYTWDNRISFSHLFLKGWDATREINSYPPTAGPLAIYVIDDFYNTIDFAFDGYSNLSKAIGSYSYINEDNTIADMNLCLYSYKQGDIFGFNESYIFNSEIVKSCINISHDINDGPFISKPYLESQEIKFSALVRATLDFSLKTVNFKSAGRTSPPNCYQFNIQILFDNEDHDGQMIVSLDAEPLRLNCKGVVEYVTESKLNSLLRSFLNYLIIVVCTISLGLCGRAIRRAQKLKNQTEDYFKNTFNKTLCCTDRRKFLNLWYVMIIVNDVLIIIGSSIQEQIESEEFTSDQWNVCSVCLGLGNLLVWFGVLRYLGFFKNYNVVMLTLEKAAPQVSRFLLCAILIYSGFTFCGWLVFGPYHLKFKSLSTTSETLFSLINGDDMFATFTIMSNKSTMLWWFSRIYLYSFISLYIYIILSLFISVIMDAYDTIKMYYIEGFPKSDLQIFIGDTNIDDVSSGLFRSSSSDSLGGIFKDFCCCKNRNRSYSTIPRSASKYDQPV